MTNILKWVGVAGFVIAVFAAVRTFPVSVGQHLGAAGGMLAENYIPYVMYNGGYNSAKPIATTDTLNAAAATFTGTLTGVAGVFSGLVQTDAGQLHSYTNSTSTTATSQTLAVSDVNAYDTVILTPNVGTDTVTFFASSTASTWLPTAGDTQRTCFVNGTTTAGIYIIFAGGTGTTLQVASSSTSVLGSTKLGPQKVGCFNFVRGNATATTFDILAGYTAYQ